MSVPATLRYQIEGMYLTDQFFTWLQWYESMDEVNHAISINFKRFSYRITDKWTGQVEYRWAKQMARAKKEWYENSQASHLVLRWRAHGDQADIDERGGDMKSAELQRQHMAIVEQQIRELIPESMVDKLLVRYNFWDGRQQ